MFSKPRRGKILVLTKRHLVFSKYKYSVPYQSMVKNQVGQEAKVLGT